MNKLLAILALPVSLAGCAVSSTAPKFVDAPVPAAGNGKAVLYIFREYAQPTAMAADFQMDDRPVVALAQEGFTWIYVTPGKHRFTQKWPSFSGMPALNFEEEFEANKTYVFEIRGRSTITGRKFEKSTLVFGVEEERAKRVMTACCRYVEAAPQ